MHRSEPLEVKVENQILWIGGAAYPVQNVARAQNIASRPDRATACRRYLGALVFWLILAVGLTAFLSGVSSRSSSTDLRDAISTAVLAVRIAFIILVASCTAKFLIAISRRTLYILDVETSGTPHAALVSTDQRVVDQLVCTIIDAINNPRARFSKVINNYGDQYNQYGNRSVGKVLR